MNKKNVPQYLFLILIGILLNYRLLPYGDYCSKGLGIGLSVLFFGAIFLISFAIICIINVYQKIRKKHSFDYTPVIIFVTFCLIFYGLKELNYSKFWTNTILVATISEDKPTNGELILYENGTFNATVNYFSCTYGGNYELQQDRLKLLRKDLASETQNLFTQEYIIRKREKKIKPIDLTYGTFKVIEAK